MIQEKDKDKYWNNSFQFSRSVVFDSLPPHGLQHTRPPCPSPTPGTMESQKEPLKIKNMLTSKNKIFKLAKVLENKKISQKPVQ